MSDDITLIRIRGLMEWTLADWMIDNGLDPDGECPGELFEVMPEELQREYFIKHGIPFEDDEYED
jgi:hypothetical protein